MEKPSQQQEGAGRWGLVVVAAIMLVALVYAFRVAPPYEGDAFEYSETALHWVRHGTMVERHLRNYNIPERRPGNAAGQRANYYTVFVAPFAAALGASPWTVFLPGLLGFLALAWCAWRAGRDWFGHAAAGWAALLCLLHPKLIYHTLKDPTPELWQGALCVTAAAFFLKKRYIHAGVALGVACFVKQNSAALLFAFLVYVLLFDRAEFRQRALWLGLAAFLAAVSPFLIRNTVLFGNPLYTEEAQARQNFDPQTLREANLLETTFTLRDSRPDSAQSGGAFFTKTLALFDVNLRDNLFGTQNMDYAPGFFQLIYILLAPFLFVGLWLGRGHPAVRLCALFLFFFILMNVMFVVPHESRYLYPAVPFGLLVGAYGAYEFARRRKGFSAGAVLGFVLITGALSMLPLTLMQTMNHHEQERGREYTAACRYLNTAASEDAVIMAWPPFASTFYADRPTVPYPYGGISEQLRAVKRFGVTHVVFADMIPEGEPPDLDFLHAVAKGRYVSLYEVDRDAQGYVDNAASYKNIDDVFNPLQSLYRWTMNLPLRMDWPLEKILSMMLPGGVITALVMLLILFAGYHRAVRGAGFVRGAAAVILLSVICLGARLMFFHTLDLSVFDREPSPVNVPQTRAVAGPHIRTLVLVGDKKKDADYEFFLKKEFPRVVYPERDPGDRGRTAWFVPLRERPSVLRTADDVAAWRKYRAGLDRAAIERVRRAPIPGLAGRHVGGGLVFAEPAHSDAHAQRP